MFELRRLHQDALRFMFMCWIGGRFAGLPKNLGQDVGGIRWWIVEFNR